MPAWSLDRARHTYSIPYWSDGYFDVVILRYGPTAELDHRIDGGLRNNRRYEQIAKLPYYTMFGPGDYWIWRRVK